MKLWMAVFFSVSSISAQGQETWQFRPTGTQFNFVSVAFGGGVFVAAHESTTTSFARWSADAITWAPATIPKTAKVVFAAGRFVGISATTIWTSEDGKSSTVRFSQTPEQNFSPIDVCRGDAGWVAVGTYGGMHSVDNGDTWNPVSFPTPRPIRNVAFGDGVYLAIDSGRAAFVSPDGVSWTLKSQDVIGYDATYFSYDRGRFTVVYGVSSLFKVSTSEDRGLSWQDRGSSETISGGYFSQETFVGVGQGGRIVSGSAASAAQGRNSGVLFNLKSVAFGNGLWVAVGEQGSTVVSDAAEPPLAIPQLEVQRSLTLKWPTQQGRWYQPQSSTDGQFWNNVGLPLYGDGNAKSWTDESAPVPAMIYRVQVR